jgi:hypothetical protein
MSYCACDYDAPSVYDVTWPTAKKVHRCIECGCDIQPGEKYERVFGIWNGDRDTPKTCARCVDMREWVKAHVPCFCWAHHNLHEDCVETARGYAHEAPGLLFGTRRRQAVALLHRKMTRAINTYSR